MKMVLLLASVVLTGSSYSQVADGAPSSSENATTETRNAPSLDAARTMIVGKWDYMVGPNPSVGVITRTTFSNDQCWSRYKIIGVQWGQIKNKFDAYIVEIELTSSGGMKGCGQSGNSSYKIALIPVGTVVDGKAGLISWLDCNSKKDFEEALRSQDPRASNVMCSSYDSSRE